LDGGQLRGSLFPNLWPATISGAGGTLPWRSQLQHAGTVFGRGRFRLHERFNAVYRAYLEHGPEVIVLQSSREVPVPQPPTCAEGVAVPIKWCATIGQSICRMNGVNDKEALSDQFSRCYLWGFSIPQRMERLSPDNH
jgi:hypothetical protein